MLVLVAISASSIMPTSFIIKDHIQRDCAVDVAYGLLKKIISSTFNIVLTDNVRAVGFDF